MTATTFLPSDVAPNDSSINSTNWRTFTGKRVIVHAPENSYAIKRAPSEAREAEHLAETLEKLLQPAKEKLGAPVHIYLSDPPLQLPGENSSTNDQAANEQAEVVNADSIRRIVQPEAPGEPLAKPLTRLLVARWFGTNVSSLSSLLDGLAGNIAAKGGSGATLGEINEHLRAEIAAGHPVPSISAPPIASSGAPPNLPGAPPMMPPNGAPVDNRILDSPPNRVPGGAAPIMNAPMPPTISPAQRENLRQWTATSFVSWLLQNQGADAFRRFLSEYDPARRDAAAIAAYQRPLGALEDAWMSEMRTPPGGKAVFTSFLRRVWPLMKPYRLRQLEIFVYMAIGVVYSQAIPFASKYLLDHIGKYFQNPNGVSPTAFAWQLLVPFAGCLLVIYTLNALATMRRAYVTAWINEHVLMGLREKMFEHLQRLSHAFYANARVGDVMSRLSNDLQMVQNAMAQVTNTAIYQSFVALAAIGTVMYQTTKHGAPIMGLLMLCIMPFFMLGFAALRKNLQSASREQQQRIGEATTAVQENLSAQAVIKAFSMEERAVASYHVRVLAQLKSSLHLAVLGSLLELSANITMGFGQLIVLVVGGYLVLQNPQGASGDHGMTIGTLSLLSGLLVQILAPVAALSGVGQAVQMASGAMDRTNELFDAKPDIENKPNAITLPPLSTEIRIENATFGYDPARTILNGISLTIAAGQNVAIVGPSGCGKSTLLNLLLRFYDPQSGRVLFDNHDLRDVTLESLRAQIGLVFQETFVFDTTLRENIGLARPGASDDEIVAAAKAAQLDAFVQTLSAGYNTVLGERGSRMSGGQRQRLAIARAILRNPRILVLDEATSALDAQTEAEILATLTELARGRTTISITHRLSWAATADRIIVIDAGRVVEDGPHAQLVKAGGLYQKLYEEQTGYATGNAPLSSTRIDPARLKDVPLFASLDEKELQSLANQMVLERDGEGVEVVRQGDAGDKLYVLSRGQAEVCVRDGHAPGERRVNVLNAGDFFGEAALLSGAPRNATVRTTTPSELLSLSQQDFKDLLEREPALRQALEKTVAARRNVPVMQSATR